MGLLLGPHRGTSFRFSLDAPSDSQFSDPQSKAPCFVALRCTVLIHVYDFKLRLLWVGIETLLVQSTLIQIKLPFSPRASSAVVSLCFIGWAWLTPFSYDPYGPPPVPREGYPGEEHHHHHHHHHREENDAGGAYGGHPTSIFVMTLNQLRKKETSRLRLTIPGRHPANISIMGLVS